MKKLLTILVVSALLLSSCGTSNTNNDTDSGAAETIEDIFTAGSDTEDEGSDTEYEIIEGTIIGISQHGFTSDYYDDGNGSFRIYEGDEMSLDYGMYLSDMSEEGLGIELFLDGQPQPYRVEGGDGDGNEDYAYIHTFYPEDNIECTYTFLFIPVTGEEGDMLELWAAGVWNPTYFWDEEANSLYQTGMGSSVARTRLKFNATPTDTPTAEDASELVTSYSVSTADITDDEIGGWSDEELLTKIGYSFYVNDHFTDHAVYGVSSNDTFTATFEIWGNPYMDFSFVLFVDHLPVLVDGQSFNIDIQNGQKVIITVELDLSYFEGQSIVYGHLVPRNYTEVMAADLDGGSYYEGLGTFYLTSVSSWEELIGETTEE